LTGRWVVVAAGRGKRPNEFRLAERLVADPADCPFCPGREDRTTPEIVARGRPAGAPADTPGWRLRCFPNLFPAVRPDAAAGAAPEGLVALPGVGRHEVVVFSPEHADGPAGVGPDGLAELLCLLRDRAAALAALPDHRYVLAFVNHGPEAGATLAHPHAQIIATPRIPDTVLAKAARFAGHRDAGRGCLLCDHLAQEEAAGARVVAAGPEAVVVAPWASRLPFELLVVPRRHQPDFTAATDTELAATAAVLHRALAALDRLHPDPPLNLVVHGAPLGDGDGSGAGAPFHWHLEVVPRLTRLAGFEAGTGFFINSLPPETAARRLRGEEA
jgi:UDPglucose--hexose-1-phosphate uridylyltransferase